MTEAPFDLSRSSDCGPQFDLGPTIDDDEDGGGEGGDSSPTFDLSPDAPCARTPDYAKTVRFLGLNSVLWFQGCSEAESQDGFDLSKQMMPICGTSEASTPSFDPDPYCFVKDNEEHLKAIVDELVDRDQAERAYNLASCPEHFPCGNRNLCTYCRGVKQGNVRDGYIDKALNTEARLTQIKLFDDRLYDTTMDARKSVVNAFGNSSRGLCAKKFDFTDEWYAALVEQNERSYAERLQREYADRGRWVPFSEIVVGGARGVHIEQEDGRYTGHLDVIADAYWLPQDLLEQKWDEALDADGDSHARLRSVESAYNPDKDDWKELVGNQVAYPVDKVHVDDPKELVDYQIESGQCYVPFGSWRGTSDT